MATAALVIALIGSSITVGINAVTLVSAIKSASTHTAHATATASKKVAHASVHVATLGRK